MSIAKYVMLVTFITPGLDKLTAQHLQMLEASPFNGVAVKLMSAYDTEPVPGESHFEYAVRLCKGRKVDVWPWVFLNRMIGRDPKGRTHASAPEREYFVRIRAMDLDNETGAREDFVKIWRLALRLAKAIGAPGIVADFEAYNNYLAYDPAWVARRRGESVDQGIEKLKALGAELADVVEQEYPGATILQLFFDPYARPYKTEDGRALTRTSNYICMGMLERAAERGIDLTVVDGGETSVGYYNASLDALRRKITRRAEAAKELLARFGGRVRLGGTIAPYADAAKITGWLRRAAGENPPLRKAADFVPLFRELFRAYDMVWIYVGSSSATNPYQPETIEPVYRALRAALGEAQGG